MFLSKRSFLTAWLASAIALPQARAARAKSLSDPLLLGVEAALIDTGLAGRLQRSFSRDTGLTVQLAPGTSAAVLTALEAGEVDASLTDAPDLEAALEKQGLAHDRQLVAQTELVLVGTIDPAGVKGGSDLTAALNRVSQTQSRFISAPQGSGAHLAELALWRAARVAPAPPWYLQTPDSGDALAMASTEAAYTLVERGRWLAQRQSRALSTMVQGDARGALPVHVMRSFRMNHPAAKLFVRWVSGSQGRHVAAGIKAARPAGAP